MTISLHQGQLHSFTAPSGSAWIKVQQGEIWLTGSNSSEDLIARKGERIPLPEGSKILVESLVAESLYSIDTNNFTIAISERLSRATLERRASCA